MIKLHKLLSRMSLAERVLNSREKKIPKPQTKHFAFQNTILKVDICKDLGNIACEDFHPFFPVTAGPGPNSSATNIGIGWHEWNWRGTLFLLWASIYRSRSLHWSEPYFHQAFGKAWKAWKLDAHFILFFWSLSSEPTNFMKFKHIVYCIIIDEILEKWTNYTQCTQAQLN